MQYVCVCVLFSWLAKESGKVHSQYQRDPAAGFATKEQRCPGRKIKRERCGEYGKEGAKEKEEVYEKEGEWGWVYSHILPSLPQALQRLCLAYNTSGNVSESWRVPPALFSQAPKPILLIPLFWSPFSFQPTHCSLHFSYSLFSLCLLVHSFLSSWPLFDINFIH